MHHNKVKNIVSGVWMIEPNQAKALLPTVFDSNAALVASANVNPEDVKELESNLVPISNNVVGGNSSESKVFAGVVSMKEPIVKYSDMCSTGMDQVSRRINQLANDDSVACIILDIDSPGGSADAVQLPSQSIQDARKKKPVIAYVGDGMCASAAYWIASHCDEIYATFNTDTIGSIGTYVTIMDIKGWYEKEGLKIHEIYASESTEKNLAFREALEGKYETITSEYLDKYNSEFIQTVKTNRGENLDDSVLKGKLYFSEDALKLGLIDGLSSFEETISRGFELSADDKYSTNMNFGKKTAIQQLIKAEKEDRTPEMNDSAIAELNEAGLSAIIVEQSEEADNAISSLNEIGLETAATIVATFSDIMSDLAAYEGMEEITGEQGASTIKKLISIAQSETKEDKPSDGGAPEQKDGLAELDQLEHNRTADNR